MNLSRQFSSPVALLVLFFIATSGSTKADGPATSPEKEAELIAILQSDASKAEKAVTCKSLAIYGSSKSVPDLAKLLSDEQLASWARIPLEAIPGSEAEDALRNATESLKGNLLIGTINSIGVRRVGKASDQLAVLLKNPDAEVASAAAVALGQIGSEATAKTLREAVASVPPEVRSSVAEGCVLCAERLLAKGNAAEAASLCDLVRSAEVPHQRVLEATRGAILARKEKGIALLLEQFRSPDKSLFRIALSTAREFPGKEIDQSLADELVKATPERAALMIDAMADRSQTVVLPAVLKAAKSGPKEVRIAATAALGRVGNTTCLSTLLDNAVDSDEEVVKTAKNALADIPGESIDKEIVARLAKPEGKIYTVLLELIGLRRIDAMPALLKALDHSDKAVRSAALTSLGATVPPDKLSVLIKQVASPKNADDAAVAQVALKAACVRMADREACAGELAAALERAPVPTKIVLLKILGAVTGAKALNTIAVAAKNNDPQLQDVASELLGDWMTIDAAPVLLDLAKTAPAEKFQIRAIKGYIKVARQFVMPEPERILMCHRAFEACNRPAEQKLVLQVLQRYPNIENLKLAIVALQSPELKEDASQTALVIAQKLGDNAEARELLAGADLSKVKLEIVKAEYGAGSTQKDVTEILQKQAVESPLITLSAASYNETFGGDPAPNMPKKLRVQYRINDKAGDVTFAENALIVLPLPK